MSTPLPVDFGEVDARTAGGTLLLRSSPDDGRLHSVTRVTPPEQTPVYAVVTIEESALAPSVWSDLVPNLLAIFLIAALATAVIWLLIDQLLGVPMEQVLGKVQLAESVQQAILSRGGVYGPFLALAESCERDAGEAARLSEHLFMSAGQVNAAQLSALVWSQEVGAAEAPY